MTYELIICEKPTAAKKIAEALADNKPKKLSTRDKVPYYTLTHEGKEIIIAAAVGHLYGLKQKQGLKSKYPIFDIEWAPTSDISKSAKFSKKYLLNIKRLAKDAKEFTVASVDYNEITPILYKNEMKLIKIGELVDNIINKKKRISDFKVPSFNNSGIIKFKKLKKAIRHKINEDLYELSLDYGRKVRLTSSHNIFTYKEGKIKLTKTTDLKIGNKIFCPNFLPSPKNKIKEINLLDLITLKKKRDIYISGKDVAQILKKRIINKKRKTSHLNEKRIILTIAGRKKIKNKRIKLGYSTSIAGKKAKISQPTIVMWENNNKNPSLKLFSKYLSILKLEPKSFLNNSKYCIIKESSFKNVMIHNYKTQYNNFSNLSRATIPIYKLKKTELNKLKKGFIYGSKNKRNKLPIKLKVDKELIRLMGYYLAEGDINNNYRIRFNLGLENYGHENIIIKEIEEFCNKYGIIYHKYLHKKIKHQIITIDNSVLAMLFKNIFKFGNKAINKKIPSIIFNISENLKKEFLRAYFLGDGSLSKGDITFNTASKELASGLSYLMLQLKIMTSISKVKCKTSKSNNYMWRINITNSKDIKKIKKIWIDHHKSNIIKFPKISMKKRNVENLNNISQLKIKDIKIVQSSKKFVYDLSVQGENFIAGLGGICCHNTDYDIEGEVIGLNIIRFACKQKDAYRMKFSTLTKDDLIKAYQNKKKHLDWPQAHAGETRHKMDWYFGINLSRALTASIKQTGSFKLMSTGRVQGPALKLVVDKEKEIQAFKPDPYWEIQLTGDINKGNIIALHELGKIFEKQKAEKIYKNCKDEKTAKITKVEKKQFQTNPPFPFDLTSLQIEAHKCIFMSPKNTLSTAQELYSNGYISYPRTSSQQLPKEIGYQKILNQLAKQKNYQKETEFLLKKSKLQPNNGKKTDPAHPAIFPTGVIPKFKSDYEKKLYDLIVKRFFAVFGDPATRQTMTVTLDCKQENFITKGTTTLEKAWFELYEPYVKLKEEELPKISKGDICNIKKLEKLDKETTPPKRFSESSLIKALEKNMLGTKSTRSSIIETLFLRGFIDGKAIQATELGIRTEETLEKHSPKIVEPALTRHFEEDMEKIREGKEKPEDVLEESQKAVTEITDEFNKHIKQIGEELLKANKETRNVMTYVGKCPNCKDGELYIRRGKFGQFIACNKYPDCKTIFSIPQVQVRPTKEICETCGHPKVKIIKKRRGPEIICINPKCPSKLEDYDKEQLEEMKEIESGTLKKKCSKCKIGNIKVRKSIYGSFLACDQYPKCRYVHKLENDAPLKKDFKKKPKSK